MVSTSPVRRDLDASGLHVPQLGQRQVQQPVVERLPQGQHDPNVQEPLPVVLQHADQASYKDYREKRRPRQLKANHARGLVERGIEQHAVDDEPHEERLDHLECGDHERQGEQGRDRISMRRQPPRILAQVLTTLAAR